VILINIWITAHYLSSDIEAYLTPSLILLTFALIFGLYQVLVVWLPQRLPEARVTQRLIALLLLALILVPNALSVLNDVSAATLDADRFGEAVVQTAPAQALIISDTENHTFAIRYAALVTQQRLDLALIDVRVLPQFDWARRDLALGYPQLGLVDNPSFVASSIDLEHFLLLLPDDLPVIFTYHPALPAGYRLEASPDGLTYRLIAP
jgi:hypothetical protein